MQAKLNDFQQKIQSTQKNRKSVHIYTYQRNLESGINCEDSCLVCATTIHLGIVTLQRHCGPGHREHVRLLTHMSCNCLPQQNIQHGIVTSLCFSY